MRCGRVSGDVHGDRGDPRPLDAGVERSPRRWSSPRCPRRTRRRLASRPTGPHGSNSRRGRRELTPSGSTDRCRPGARCPPFGRWPPPLLPVHVAHLPTVERPRPLAAWPKPSDVNFDGEDYEGKVGPLLAKPAPTYSGAAGPGPVRQIADVPISAGRPRLEDTVRPPSSVPKRLQSRSARPPSRGRLGPLAGWPWNVKWSALPRSGTTSCRCRCCSRRRRRPAEHETSGSRGRSARRRRRGSCLRGASPGPLPDAHVPTRPADRRADSAGPAGAASTSPVDRERQSVVHQPLTQAVSLSRPSRTVSTPLITVALTVVASVFPLTHGRLLWPMRL